MPKGTRTLRSLYVANGAVDNSGREYLGYPNVDDDYYLWHDDDVPSEVPDSARGNAIKVGRGRPSNADHFTMFDAEDPRFSDDRLNYIVEGGHKITWLKTGDNNDGRIFTYNFNDNEIYLRVYYIGNTKLNYLLSENYHKNPTDPDVHYLDILPIYNFNNRKNKFRMPQGGRQGWIE